MNQLTVLSLFKPLIPLIISLLASMSVSAQKNGGLYLIKDVFEFGIQGGGAVYFGDLNTSSDFSQIKPGGGAYSRINFNDRIAIKVSAFAGQVAYSDRLNSNPYQKARNISFRSNIYEGTGQLEFNFFPFKKGSSRDFFSPYMLMGATLARINPQAFDSTSGEWIDLIPLGTEGQKSATISYRGENYAEMQPAFSIGGGLKYSLSPNLSIDLECNYKAMFTDYLDDVSTRYFNYAASGPLTQQFADPSDGTDPAKVGIPGKLRGDRVDNDSYMTISLGFSFTFRTSHCPPPSNKGF